MPVPARLQWFRMRWLTILVLLPPLGAEFLSVEMNVSGLDCASCAGSVERVVRRVKGVESVSFRLQPVAAAEARLKPGNTTPLDEFRDAMKRLGYTPGDAKIEAAGSIESHEGTWRFRPSGIEQTYRIEIAEKIDLHAGEAIVEGVIPTPADRTKPEVLRLRAIRKPK